MAHACKSSPTETARAFTLIELLVVVTIIVVLLALLTPALDQAIHQAELTSCGANLDAVAGGINSYAFDHRRNYPYRPRARGKVWILPMLYDGNPTRRQEEGDPTRPQDDRLTVAGYIPMSAFVDPLCEELDLDPQQTDPDSICFSSNVQLWGVALTAPFAPAPFRGMYKVGDKLFWNWDYDGDGVVEKFRFNVLAADYITRSVASDPEAQASHPDGDGIFSAYQLQNEPHNNTFLGVPQSQKANLSIWRRAGSPDHGPIDLNTAYADGSVGRIQGVKPVDATIKMDDRVVPIPGFTNGGFFSNIVTYVAKN